MTGSARMLIRRSKGMELPGSVAECGCCGSRFFPRRVRMWLAEGDLLHGEICPVCILMGPHGAASRLRERIGERERQSPERGNRGSSKGWSGWMTGRVRLLETLECFPLNARQAAVREMRETR